MSVSDRLVEAGYKKNVHHFTKGKKNIYLINENFKNLMEVLKGLKVEEIDGIIADLGWSSDQLGAIAGLSYENELEALDMRINAGLGVKASDLLNALGRKELQAMFEKYCDLFGAKNRALVEEIVKERKSKLFENVGDLLRVINRAFGFGKNKFLNNQKFSTYSRIFQALRIAVNDEYSNLKEMLINSFEVLNSGGRMAVITFHSGEEKFVTDFIKEKLELEGAELNSKTLGDMYIRPSVEELKENLRARSAKLFVFKKLTD